jgi:hypothetical protein
LESWFFCVTLSLHICCTGMALKAVQESLIDPRNVFSTWDITLVTPCTWTNIACDSQNHVINLWVSSPPQFIREYRRSQDEDCCLAGPSEISSLIMSWLTKILSQPIQISEDQLFSVMYVLMIWGFSWTQELRESRTVGDTFATNWQPAVSAKPVRLPELTGFPKFQELGWSNMSWGKEYIKGEYHRMNGFLLWTCLMGSSAECPEHTSICFTGSVCE